MPDATSDPSSLVAVAIANAFALSSAVYIASKISGGHVNPAVTFGMTVGGHISVPTALFYWVSQMLAAVMASLLLKLTVVGQVILYITTFHIPSTLHLIFKHLERLTSVWLLAILLSFAACSNLHYCRRNDRVWSVAAVRYPNICLSVHCLCCWG